MADKTKDEKPEKTKAETKPFYKHVPLMAATIASVIVLLVVGYFAFQSTNQSDELNTEDNLTQEEIEFNKAVEENNFGPSQEEREARTPEIEQAVEASIGTDQEAEKRYELAQQYIEVAEYKKAATENNKATQLAKAQQNTELLKALKEQANAIDSYLNLLERYGS